MLQAAIDESQRTVTRHRRASSSTRATSSSPAASPRARSTTPTSPPSRRTPSTARPTPRDSSASTRCACASAPRSSKTALTSRSAQRPTSREATVVGRRRDGWIATPATTSALGSSPRRRFSLWCARCRVRGGRRPGRADGEPTHPLVEAFTTSLPFDRRLYAHDIAGSIAHCRMLAQADDHPAREAPRIVARSAADPRASSSRGAFRAAADRRGHPHGGRAPADREDRRDRRQAAHGAQPQRPGRARPAPVSARRRSTACAERHARAAARPGDAGARATSTSIMPGYTHLQPAQPVLFAHHLLAYAEMLARDDCRVSPTAASASTSCRSAPARWPAPPSPSTAPTSPASSASAAISHNSLDAVSDRDFAVEFLAAAAVARPCTSAASPRSSSCGRRSSSASSSSPTPSPPAAR